MEYSRRGKIKEIPLNMKLHFYFPQPPLSNFVDRFWLCEDYHPPYAKERILPVGMMELVINLCNRPVRVSYPDLPSDSQCFRETFVAGARSRFFIVDTARPSTVLGMQFKPGAALPIFKASAGELHNLHVPLDTLWGMEAHDLYCQVLEARTPKGKFRVVEQALSARLARFQGKGQHRAIALSLPTFNNLPYTSTVSQVIDQIGISPTRFIQVFSEEIGLTPKLFCRLRRFQEVLRRIIGGKPGSWADLAVTCGYYDQAHLINDFQTFAGISPSQYLPPNSEHPNNLSFLD
jgi:AraC-like DNA-binding protein